MILRHRRERLSEVVGKMRHERNALQRLLSRKSFRFTERLGFHVVGNHFYEPIPDLREIDQWWTDDSKPCDGIDLRSDECDRYLQTLLGEAGSFSTVYASGFRDANPSYTSLDALALYCFIRREQPATVVEVGQGWSTRVIVAALGDNHREGCRQPRLVTIDPHPRLDAAAFDTTIEIDEHRRSVQTAAAEVQQALAPGDLLFIDSSHVHKPGSDVETVFDVLLPHLPVGAYAHLHDIYTPFRYPRDWYLRDKRFWNEGEHLENFLRFNGEFEVMLPLQYLIRRSTALARWWDTSVRGPIEGSAFYIQRVALDVRDRS